jgi:hypothetical protein
MQLGLCCCEVEPCTGCRKALRYDLTNITVEFDDTFAWDPVSATCSPTGYEIIQYAADAANIVSGIELRKRTSTLETGYGYLIGSSLCQWLWNDPIAVQSLYHWRTTGGSPSTFYEGTTTELSQYVPVNATDATSPWNRVLTTITDPTCGSCVWTGCTNAADKWKCITGVYWSHVRLDTVLFSGVPYWLVTVRAYLERSVSGPFSNQGAHPIGSLYGGAGGGSCGNYIGTNAGQLAERRYRKAIDCNADFNGDPIVLSFYDSPGGSLPFTSYATTVSLILNAL